MTNTSDHGVPGVQSGRRTGRLLGITVLQVGFGCLLVWLGLRYDNWFLLPIGVLIGSWFWIPLSMATRDKPKARARFWYGLLAAWLLVAALMVAAFFLVRDKGYEAMLGVGLVGGICLVAPLALAWAGSGESARRQQPWGRFEKGPRTVAGLGLSVDADSDPESIRLGIEVTDPGYLGQSASLEIYRFAEVHDSAPVNDIQVLSSQELVLHRERIDLELPAGPIRGLTYRGKQVSVTTFAELRLYDGVLWDTMVRTEVSFPEHRLPDPQGDAKLLTDPKDAFCLASNLQAIPLHRRAVVLVLFAVGGVVMAINAAVGLHDQFAPAGGHVMYTHGDDDDSQSPLMNSLFLSGFAGTAIWMAIRRQLRSYTTFQLRQTPGTIGRDTVLAIDELIRGRPVVDLENVTVRVVACNLEQGSYTRGSGSNARVVNFSEPVRAVMLFEQHVPSVRRGQPLEASLSGSVRFAAVFDLLHPPCRVSKTHGLALQWELQLLHDRFVDHELVAPRCEYRTADFAATMVPLPEASDARMP